MLVYDPLAPRMPIMKSWKVKSAVITCQYTVGHSCAQVHTKESATGLRSFLALYQE